MNPEGMPGPNRLGTVEWLICIIAAIGFAFDIYELLMLPLIIKPAIAALSGPLVQAMVQAGTSCFSIGPPLQAASRVRPRLVC